MFGEPASIGERSNNREIYFYPTFKVSFVDHKVVDAQ